MAGVYIAFMVAFIVCFAIHRAAQYRTPDHEAPSDAAGDHRAQDDDAA